MSGEQTFVPRLVNMFKISKLLVFEILDNFDTEVVINLHEEGSKRDYTEYDELGQGDMHSQQKEDQGPNMLRSHESCEPEVHEWKIARILSFLSNAELSLKTKLRGTYQSFHTVFSVGEMLRTKKGYWLFLRVS